MSSVDQPIGEDDLQAAVDGRLDAGRCALVSGYLAANPEAASRVGRLREQRAALRERLAAKAAEPLPPRLRIAHVLAERRRKRLQRVRRVAAILVWLAIGAALGWVARDGFQHAAPARLTAEAIAAHRTFVVEVRHPVEVDATQEAHLVQWLSRRLGRPLKAPDLAADGYRLMGGRLLSASAGPAAQLMYEDAGGQRLTLYLRADGEGGTAFRYAERGDVGAFYWVEDGFGYAVSGPADRQKLLHVAEAVYRQCAEPAQH